MSRGIDVDGISLVINYNAPPDPEDYIHRIGRTARAEKAGVAITLVNERDQIKLSKIEDLMGFEVARMTIPSELGLGPEYNPAANKKNFRILNQIKNHLIIIVNLSININSKLFMFFRLITFKIS